MAERHRARRLEAEVGRAGAARVGVGLEGLELVARDVGEHPVRPAHVELVDLRREPLPRRQLPLLRRRAQRLGQPPRARRVGGSERLVGDQLEAHAVVLFARVLQRREVGGLGQVDHREQVDRELALRAPVEQRAAHRRGLEEELVVAVYQAQIRARDHR